LRVYDRRGESGGCRFEAGATEIVISDSHGNGENLLIERLPKNVTIVRRGHAR
jgi:D-amino peptidase